MYSLSVMCHLNSLIKQYLNISVCKLALALGLHYCGVYYLHYGGVYYLHYDSVLSTLLWCVLSTLWWCVLSTLWWCIIYTMVVYYLHYGSVYYLHYGGRRHIPGLFFLFLDKLMDCHVCTPANHIL